MLRSVLAAAVLLAFAAVVPALADTVPYGQGATIAAPSTITAAAMADVISATLTPDPARLMLLGTSMLGAAGMLRRRARG